MPMPTPAHIGKERYARTCPDRRKVITATDEQHGMKGHDGGTKKKKQRREERMKEATHHRGESQHT